MQNKSICIASCQARLGNYCVNCLRAGSTTLWKRSRISTSRRLLRRILLRRLRGCFLERLRQALTFVNGCTEAVLTFNFGCGGSDLGVSCRWPEHGSLGRFLTWLFWLIGDEVDRSGPLIPSPIPDSSHFLFLVSSSPCFRFDIYLYG